ncbi:hypothetical protein D9Q98_008021 [Chlorella vulgaris]|uniref:RNA polymerase I-specific transcription initiation factor RRN3 n=1 Tax=Chlorella vulgaris TaxID=3077 RepID=A0A9D4TI07_CHLVU|nr:hypothetical protein D9Q98_008021 [Chlorella vulgaris]
MSTDSEADELLRHYVHEALSSKATGGSTALYDRLVGEVKRLKVAARVDVGCTAAPDPVASTQLAAVVRGLAMCVSLLHERRHELLVKELLELPLWHVPQELRVALLDWVTHVVVANGALVQSCLQTLVYSLLPPPGPPQPDPNPGEAWRPQAGQELVQDAVLEATEQVLLLVPTAGSRLLPLVVANFPHKLRDRNTQCLFLRAVYALAEGRGGAGIREGLLTGATEHLISIDVEIRWEDIADVHSEETKEEAGGLPPEEEPDIFELEGMSELDLATHDGSSGGEDGASPRPAARGGWEGGHALLARAGQAAGQQGAPAGPKGAAVGVEAKPAVDETADKLDSLMELSFGHLQRRHAAAGQPTKGAFETLLAAFERSVLLTHRSKFTQFLLFYSCRQAPEPRCRAFLRLLINRMVDRQQPPIARSACAAYAASFLARAAFCPEHLVVDSLQRLADYCLRYSREEDRRGGLPPIPSATSIASGAIIDSGARHGTFYAAFQALLYVLCYHMEPLLRPTRARPTQDAAAGSAAAADAAAAAAAGGQAAGSLGTSGVSGGTPASADTPTGMKAQERRESAAHEKREACAKAVRQLFSAVMPQLLQHRSLNALGGCARSVVAEFGRQLRVQGFTDLARMVRDWERRHAQHSKAAHRHLELFFPFDPYLLRRSASFLELEATYVRWRRGHPAGAVRADLESSDTDSGSDDELADELASEMSDDEAAAAGGQDVSGLDDSSSDDDSSDDSSDSSSSSSSSGYESSSESEAAEELKRTRFGSLPGSSIGSDYRARKRPHLPGALKAPPLLFGGPSASPTLGFAVPHHGSLSSGGSTPFGISPMGSVPFAAGPVQLPAFGSNGAVVGALHLGLSNVRP